MVSNRRAVVIGALVVVGLLVAVGAGIAATFEQPQVTSVESQFGDVGEQTADVETTVVVENPNDRSIPGSLELGYAVSLNDITVASGSEPGVSIGPGENTIQTTATFDNTKIPAWWVSHVNNGEQTTLRTEASVELLGPFSPQLPAETRTIETDFVGSLGTNEVSTVALGETELVVVGAQTGEWGEADAETTPLRFSTELENVHDRPVRIDGTDYEIRMNDVVVGEGRTDDGIELAPGESGTFEVGAAIDTPKMQEWWVTHLRNDESTTLAVEVYAVVDDGQERTRLPVAIFQQRAAVETDLLGSGETSVQRLEPQQSPQFSRAQIQNIDSEWAEVRDEETDIRTTVELVNDNDEAFTDLVTLNVSRKTTLAGVTVAEGTERVEEIPQGSGEIAVTTTKRHEVVPEWWAAHLRNGERSTVETAIDAEADVAVTTLPLEVEDRRSSVETDLLGDLNDDTTRREGPLTIHSTSAEWVDPTAEEATIAVEADIENDSPFGEVTIRDLDYAIDINDVVLGDDTAPESHTFDAGERKTVEFTIVLDNSRMAEWWPTHIENDETSVVTRDVSATIEAGGETERRDLDSLSSSREIETDLLADG